jgi:hypothetical protein
MWCAPIWMGWHNHHEKVTVNAGAQKNTDVAAPGIDPRSVPKSRLDWPAAFRLKPARLPGTDPLALFGEDVAGLNDLKNITSPAMRHSMGNVPLPVDIQPGTSNSVLSAFATSLPEWRFAARGTAHMLVASSISAATAIAAEIYGRFMLDTGEATSTLSFQVERFQLAGSFADVCDREVFPACYNRKQFEVPQRLVGSLLHQGEDGLVFSAGDGQGVVVLKPNLITHSGIERAVALEWNGSRFHRAYDYRDMYWRDMDD